jgi:hypothetical protein
MGVTSFLLRGGKSTLTRAGKSFVKGVKSATAKFVKGGGVKTSVRSSLADGDILKLGTKGGNTLEKGTAGYMQRLNAKTTKSGVAKNLVDEMDNGFHLMDDTQRAAMKADMKKVLIDDHGMTDDAAGTWVDDVFAQSDDLSRKQMNDALRLKGFTVADETLSKTFGLTDETKKTIGKWTIKGGGYIIGGYMVYWGINTFTGVLGAFGDQLAEEAATFVSEHPIAASAIGVAIVAIPAAIILSTVTRMLPSKKKDDKDDEE